MSHGPCPISKIAFLCALSVLLAAVARIPSEHQPFKAFELFSVAQANTPPEPVNEPLVILFDVVQNGKLIPLIAHDRDPFYFPFVPGLTGEDYLDAILFSGGFYPAPIHDEDKCIDHEWHDTPPPGQWVEKQPALITDTTHPNCEWTVDPAGAITEGCELTITHTWRDNNDPTGTQDEEVEDEFKVKILQVSIDSIQFLALGKTKELAATIIPSVAGNFAWSTPTGTHADSGVRFIVNEQEVSAATGQTVTIKGIGVSPSVDWASVSATFTPAPPDGMGHAPQVTVTENFSVYFVEWPRDDEPSINNTLVWRSSLQGNKFQLLPDPFADDVAWTITGFPQGSYPWVDWTPPRSGFDAGAGASPRLTVKDFDNQLIYDDFMPENNSWFGQKNVNITSGFSFSDDQPVWVYFYVLELRPPGEQNEFGSEAAWYFYWKQGAVPDLDDFIYDHNLDSLAEHQWSLLGGDAYAIGYYAGISGAMKPVFDVNAHTYTEEEYPYLSGERRSWGCETLCT